MTFDPTVSQEIDAVLQRYTTDPYDGTGKGVPRVVVLAADSNGILYSGASGYEQLPPHPATEDQLSEAPMIKETSIFELFSCTKLVATIAALQLVEQGVLSLDADASQWVPELKVGELDVLEGFGDDGKPRLVKAQHVVTIRDLIAHTSGSVYPFKDENALKIAEHLGFGAVGPNHHDARREHLTSIPMIFEPTQRWHYGYSNDWLALAVVEASGMSFEDYFQKNIFGPLGIKDISYHPNPEKISMSYATGGGPHKFGPGATQKGAELGGSGLQGSPASYLRIVRAILNGGELDGKRILKKETVDLMFQSALSKDPEVKKAQLQDLMDFATDSDPHSHARGSQVPGSIDWGLGGILLNIEGAGTHGSRGKNNLAWSGMANTFWVVDREAGLVHVAFFNTLPYADEGAFACWLEVEKLLYRGAGKA